MYMSFSLVLMACFNTEDAKDRQHNALDSPTAVEIDASQYTLSTGSLGVGQRMVTGAVTWEHTGPAVFSKAPVPWTGSHWVTPSPPSTQNPIIGAKRVDSQGRLWTAVAVDEAALSDIVMQYDLLFSQDEQQAPAQFSDSGSPDTGNNEDTGGIEDSTDDTESGWLTLESYSTVTCSFTSAGDNKNHVWSSGLEDVIVNSEMSTYETDPVVYMETLGTGCSGVLIRNDVVLTAAHCLVTPVGTYVTAAGDIDICSRGNWNGASPTCQQGKEFTVSPTFSEGSTISANDDWALIRLEADIGTSNTMYMSTASASTIRSADIVLGGYPGMWRSDTSCIDNSTTANQSSLIMPGARLHLSDGQSDAVYTKGVQMDLTHGQGYSGGVYFYDPGSPGGRRYSVGVHSGSWLSITGARSTKGPRTSYWRSTWLGLMSTGVI